MVKDRAPSSARSGHERDTAIEPLAHSNALRAEDGSRSGGNVEPRLCSYRQP
jgi:hypothetical protein